MPALTWTPPLLLTAFQQVPMKSRVSRELLDLVTRTVRIFYRSYCPEYRHLASILIPVSSIDTILRYQQRAAQGVHCLRMPHSHLLV